MKITEFGVVQNAGALKKRGNTGKAGTTSFADFLSLAEETQESSHSSALSDVAANSALSNMLALQEISEGDVQRKKLLQQGKSLIDILEKLRQQLLMGTLPPHLMQELGRQLSIKKQFVSDPLLMDLIDDIELRAAVELAKLEMAYSGSQPS